jgi:hypothetical protein
VKFPAAQQTEQEQRAEPEKPVEEIEPRRRTDMEGDGRMKASPLARGLPAKVASTCAG